ncbi:MAG: tRNA (guanosine(46)-N7)-methyltransferase TrmB [Tenericutes bacterium]|nr:tRNA (guanosine(46)-N7)-methyltransferase TrmB [Mycoplasmatota bacterium]
MRLRNVKNKEEILNNSSYFMGTGEEFIGKWSNVFKNNNPIYVEIGMGKGKFIIENAIKYPNINFIGIEKYDSVVAKCLPKIPEGLDNLKILRMDALNIDKVFLKEIDRIYLNFSDPWPKVRHSLRRLSSKVFLKKYDSIFKNDKEICMRTDNRDLFVYSLLSFSEYGYVLRKLSLDLHGEDIDNLITTEYEDKFSDKGMPIYAVVVDKKDV